MAAASQRTSRNKDYGDSYVQYPTTKGILLLALVETDMATATQIWVLQPLQRKQSRFQFPDFPRRQR